MNDTDLCTLPIALVVPIITTAQKKVEEPIRRIAVSRKRTWPLCRLCSRPINSAELAPQHAGLCERCD